MTITLKQNRVFYFSKGGKKKMENEKVIIEEELEVQTTFNEDGLDILVEDGTVENLEEVADNGNENE
mgnify:CR=1 FL=1